MNKFVCIIIAFLYRIHGFLMWFCLLFLWSCQSEQKKNVPVQETDSAQTLQTIPDERSGMESTFVDQKTEGEIRVPEGFKQFIASLPEWTADSIGLSDIFYSDAETEQEYAQMFDMRSKLEKKESISVLPLFLYKVTLDNCYVLFVEKQVTGCPTQNGFYAGRWTHSLMTCTKEGRMIETLDLGNNFMGNMGYCHIRGTRSPLRLEVENVFYLVGNGEKWRAPQPSRHCQVAYHVNSQNGRIFQDSFSAYDCDRYIGKNGQNIWKNQTECVTKSRPKDKAVYQRPETVKEWIANFPEWTSDSISEHIFDASGLVSEGTVFPKEFQPLSAQDSACQQMIEMRYGHRITTDSLYILFARKICNRRNPSDKLVPESFSAQTIMVYSHDGQLKGWCDITSNTPSKNRTFVSGRRNPIRLHVKEAKLQKHEYERTHYIPVIYKEVEWGMTQDGTLAAESQWEQECRWYPYKHPCVCEPWYKQLSPL